jgi:hypothetical protein
MDKTSQQWWVAAAGDMLVWARLRVLASGRAEVFDATGETLRYDDENAARNALLDAEFRAFDGLDEEDAAFFGFDLESFEPPHSGHDAEHDAELLPLMTERIGRGHA